MSLLKSLGLKPLPAALPARPKSSPPRVTGRPAARAGSAAVPVLERRLAGGPSDQAAPVLESIRVTPANMTIDGEQELHFTATGIDSIGDPVDLTFDVEWSSSTPTAVSIDGNGKASGHPVSGKATIHALHVPSGVSGSTTVTVTMKERAGPKVPAKPKPTPMLESIAITPRDLQVVLGTGEQLTATGTYADGHRQDESQAVDWESRPANVVSVDERGVATAHRVGTAMVTATDRLTTLTDWVEVHAVAAQLLDLSIDPDEASLHGAELRQFRAIGEYSDGTSVPLDAEEVAWASSASDIVRIDRTGMAMGRKPGAAVISVTHLATRLTTSTGASVPSLERVAIEPANAAMLVDQETRFSAMGIYSDGRRKEVAGVVWSSGDRALLTIDDRGLATGRGVGAAVLTVKVKEAPKITGSTKVTLKAPALDSIRIDFDSPAPFTGSLARGQRLQFHAIGSYRVGSGKVVTRRLGKAVWTSDETKVASVKDGLVSALAVGKANIGAEDKESGQEAILAIRVIEGGAAQAPKDLDTLGPALADPYRAAKSRYDELQAQVRALDVVPQLVKSLEAILADLAKAKPDAVTNARMAELQTEQVKSIDLLLDSFRKHAESALAHLERSEKASVVFEGRLEVAALRRQGQAQMKNIKLALGLLKGAAKVAHDPLGAALEVIGGLIEKFETSAYDQAANALEGKLDRQTRNLLQADIDGAKKDLSNAKDSLDKANTRAREASHYFQFLREQAETSFDASAKKGSFRFADLTTPLRMADRIADELVPGVKQAVGVSTVAIEKALKDQNIAKTSEVGRLLYAMRTTTLGWWRESSDVGRQAEAQRTRLRELRQKIGTRLAYVKPEPSGGKAPSAGSR